MSSRFIRAVILLLLVGAGIALGAYAVEADKELRVLCGLFRPGTPEAELDRIVGTAHFLRVAEFIEGERRVREVYSPWNLRTYACRVSLAGGVVAGNEVRDAFDWLGRD